jgi:hypothetical protein
MKTLESINLPKSKLTKRQVKEFTPHYREYTDEHGKVRWVHPEVRYDDQCGNGHNSFSITGTSGYRGQTSDCGGCPRDEIAKAYPELAQFIKLHMIANTLYHAGDRDCWGLRKGEFRQHTSRGKYQADGVEGVPCWELKIEGLPDKKEIYTHEKPADVTVIARWVPHGMTGEGKERDFAAARSCAVWPEATDEQLSVEPEELRAMLMARLPALMAEFKAAMESLGFTY